MLIEGSTWPLAKRGVLDGRKATTSWQDLESFSQRISKINIIAFRFLIEGENVTVRYRSLQFDFLLNFIEERFASALASDV